MHVLLTIATTAQCELSHFLCVTWGGVLYRALGFKRSPDECVRATTHTTHPRLATVDFFLNGHTSDSPFPLSIPSRVRAWRSPTRCRCCYAEYPLALCQLVCTDAVGPEIRQLASVLLRQYVPWPLSCHSSHQHSHARTHLRTHPSTTRPTLLSPLRCNAFRRLALR